MHVSSKLRSSFVFLWFALLSSVAFDVSFAQSLVVPSGTASRAQLIKSTSVRSGQEVSAKLIVPIYLGDKLALPAGTLLQGKIVDLSTDKKKRIRTRFNGDFTPFHVAHVRFHAMTLPSGHTVPIETTQEMSSVVVQLNSSQASRSEGSYLRRAWTLAKNDARQTVAVFTDPDKGERLPPPLPI